MSHTLEWPRLKRAERRLAGAKVRSGPGSPGSPLSVVSLPFFTKGLYLSFAKM